MIDSAKQVPDGADVHELLELLINIFRAVRRLPEGPERSAALVRIKDFQSQLSAILLRRFEGQGL